MISPDEACPCGRADAAGKCCYSNGVFMKLPARTVPPGPATGKSLDACYCRSLVDCDQKRTAEHYISASILEELNRENRLKVEGFPWTDGEAKFLSPKALTAKNLCKRHNNVLSPLDAMARRMFEALDNNRVHGESNRLYLFNGHDLERWLLKTLCGLADSDNLPLHEGEDVSLPREWLEVLVCGREFSEGKGLYMCVSPGHLLEGPRGTKMRAITSSGRLSGIGLWLCGMEFILSMTGFPSRMFDGRHFIYRPEEIYTSSAGYQRSILFSWNGSADLGTVALDFAT